MPDSVDTNAPKRGRGRPSSLTDEIRDLICTAIREGNYRNVAAGIAGVPQRTFFEWVKRGKKETEGPFYQFLQCVLEAERSAEIRMLETVWKAALKDPMHARWYLERKFPERWGANRGDIKSLARQLARLKVPHVGLADQNGAGGAAAAGSRNGTDEHDFSDGGTLPDEPAIVDD